LGGFPKELLCLGGKGGFISAGGGIIGGRGKQEEKKKRSQPRGGKEKRLSFKGIGEMSRHELGKP